MEKELLRYSLDADLTPHQLKKGRPSSQELSSNQYEALDQRATENNVSGLLEGVTDFPFKFTLIKAAPVAMYYQGDITLLNKPVLGIVGPRMMSEYARQVLESLFEKLSGYDLVTISGMAKGVDQYCHTLSMKYNIPTIAVLGGGIAHYLKTTDRHIMQNIVEKGGLVLSEFKLGFTPTNWSFPQRNRIIAGLSDHLFLPEATKDSGSLITVDFALKMKKPVFAVPNHIFSKQSDGVNSLIAEGKIKMVSDFESFLQTSFGKNNSSQSLKATNLPEKENILLTPSEQKICSSLQDSLEGCDISKLCEHTKIPFGEMLMLLTGLEIKNMIIQSLPGIYFVNLKSA